MRKRYQPIAQVQTNFVNALADLIEHPDCPPVFYNDLMTLAEDWDNRFSDIINPAEDARRIRKNLPKYFRQRVRRAEEG